MASVKVRGELHCYDCGRVAARFEGEKGDDGLRARVIALATGPGVRLRPGSAPRCGHCGGRVYLDEVELVRPAPTVVASAVMENKNLYYYTGDLPWAATRDRD
ncbi:MAG TPA: hypothetical protein VNL16_04585 [Chloroflexota bacterium]|nr:hypothetical protein [Chloroflexota bacterium]